MTLLALVERFLQWLVRTALDYNASKLIGLLLYTPIHPFCCLFLAGDTIWDVAEIHKIDLGPASVGAPYEAVRSPEWTEPLFGEGPTSGFDHIILAGKGAETAPPRNVQELRMLEHYWDDDEIFPESRLACVIPVTKAMDGMIVYVPDRIVDDIP